MRDDQDYVQSDLTNSAPQEKVFALARAVLRTGGVIGMSIKNMFESVISNNSDEDDSSEQMTDGSGLMSESSDDFGDLEDLASDEMDGFDDDGFGNMDETAGADTDELEHRLDELENEVGSLSSTVSTVRTENEQISESVEEVEENVQKLLDIYEMVTNGVNPFANDVDAGIGSGGMGGDSSFGLFDDGDESGEETEIDNDVANAKAKEIFDEERSEDTDGEEVPSNRNIEDVFPDEDSNNDFEDDDGTFDENFDSGSQENEGLDGGKSFQDLKGDYESDDAEWPAEELEGGVAVEEETVDEPDDGNADLGGDKLFNDGRDANEVQNTAEEIDVESEQKSEPQPISTAEGTNESTVATQPSPVSAGKPYLVTLPSSYLGDLIAIEWLEYLLQQAGHREASRAIEYYQTIGWIHEDVADALQKRIHGFEDAEGGDGGLTIDHHTQSLQYISQLDDDGGAEAVMLSTLTGRGDRNGLQH